ncbi:MAG: hypothetical protein UT02_C0008G0011 [Parcubacteria group bacterium GW2011_GWC2_38_7]|nr:MAG: hypothetical protein UT02_C0008G0011 [Parcubacteria group bacterium GW2011_GWC2_38_7]
MRMRHRRGMFTFGTRRLGLDVTMTAGRIRIPIAIRMDVRRDTRVAIRSRNTIVRMITVAIITRQGITHNINGERTGTEQEQEPKQEREVKSITLHQVLRKFVDLDHNAYQKEYSDSRGGATVRFYSLISMMTKTNGEGSLS